MIIHNGIPWLAQWIRNGQCSADDGVGDDPDLSKSGGGHDGPKTSAGISDPSTITLTKDQFGGRLESARRKAANEATNSILESLGLADTTELQDIVERHKSSEGESKKTQRELETLKKEREQLLSTVSELTRRDQARTIKDSIHDALAEEAKKGRRPHKPEHIIRLLADEIGIEDGQVVVFDGGKVAHGKDVKTLVSDFLANNEELLQATETSGGSGSRVKPGTGGTRTETDFKSMSGDEKAQALAKLLKK